MSSKIYGVRPGSLQWADDFTATQDNKGKWDASVSFFCRIEDAVRLKPVKGAACAEPGFGFLGFDSCTVANESGGLARVTCKYVGGETDEPDFGFDDDTDLGARSELAVSTSEEPIETHPKYAELSEGDKINIQHLKAGRMKGTATAGEYLLTEDNANAKKITFEDPLAAELAGFIAKGLTSYLVAQQIYRYSYTSRSNVGASVLNKVGKITSARGAPSVGGGRNWLFVGASSQSEGSAYNISLEFRLSGPGGWQEEIYDD